MPDVYNIVLRASTILSSRPPIDLQILIWGLYKDDTPPKFNLTILDWRVSSDQEGDAIEEWWSNYIAPWSAVQSVKFSSTERFMQQ